MEQYSVLPRKYYFEQLPSVDGFDHCRVFDEKYIIKEYELCYYNLPVFEQIKQLDLSGYSFLTNIYRNDDFSKFYLVSPFYKNYCTLENAKYILANRTNGFLVIKKMLLHLKEAHQKGFNPYDIHDENYMVNSFLDVLGIDCNYSCYQKQFTFVSSSLPAYLEAFFEHSMFGDFQFTDYYLNLYDKLLILSMILYYLQWGQMQKLDLFCTSVTRRIETVLQSVSLPFSVQNYLQKVLYGSAPVYDDYFIEELIDPLISFYTTQEGQQKKKVKE